MPTVNQNQSGHQVLDPCLLGRPVHLLPQFAVRLRDDLIAAMQAPGWRRSWGAFRLESVEFGKAPDDPRLRWLGAATPQGVAAAAFERRLLLGFLGSRYGRPGAPALPAHDLESERVTATEERLAGLLTRQLAEVLYACISGARLAPVAQGVATPMAAPGRAAWTIRIGLRAAQSGDTAQFWLVPDQALMAAILQTLAPDPARSRPVRSGEPLAGALQVRLHGRLVSKEVTLAALFALKVGDVIPVAVGRADVLLDQSRLFTAAVAEHKGKLCLTSFEDAE